MNLKSLACAAVIALGVSTGADAATVDLGGVFASSNVPSYYEANFDFALPTGFSNAVLTISGLTIDDRGVLRLNGTDVDSAGINIGGSLNGAFDFNDGAGSVPYAFAAFNGARNVVLTGGFLTGANTFRLLVNDTNFGVLGTLVNGPGGPSSTTSYSLAAQLTYDEAPVGGVPEPATWALMIMGFGTAGAMLRRRRTLAA
jgi:hypothetical protein